MGLDYTQPVAVAVVAAAEGIHAEAAPAGTHSVALAAGDTNSGVGHCTARFQAVDTDQAQAEPRSHYIQAVVGRTEQDSTRRLDPPRNRVSVGVAAGTRVVDVSIPRKLP